MKIMLILSFLLIGCADANFCAEALAIGYPVIQDALHAGAQFCALRQRKG